MQIKAKLAGRSRSDLATRLSNLDADTRVCLQTDILRATCELPPDDGGPDQAFERAVSTIERLVATLH